MEYIRAFNNIIFQGNKKCLFCMGRDKYLEAYICPDCRGFLDVVNKEMKSPAYMDRAYYVLSYNRFIREIIRDYKFHERAYLYKPLAEIMVRGLEALDLIDSIDIICFVPCHRSKLTSRGYNQVELLANYIGEKISKPVSRGNLVKIKKTLDQNKLNKYKRKNNLENAFKLLDREEYRGKNILLIDDIVSTGTTVINCSREIEKACPASITGFFLISSKKI